MPSRSDFLLTPLVIALWATPLLAAESEEALATRYVKEVQPLVQRYCHDCHSQEEPEADLNLAGYLSLAEATKDSARWTGIIERLDAAQMPPPKSPQPTAQERAAMAAWFRDARDFETKRHAGDPGLVLARRLSNAEYNYTIRDLTGVDIRPAREFPIDPANLAGFDNSGESLTMSPNLLKKYLEAAHVVASHLTLTRDGFIFAPHPMLADTDRDKYCVQRIIAFYRQYNIDYADYFAAAWTYKHRAALKQPQQTLAELANARKLSLRYLETLWQVLEIEIPEVGPQIKLQALWQALPAPNDAGTELARDEFVRLRDYVGQLRKKVEPRFPNFLAGKIPTNSSPLLIWKNVQYATHRMKFDPAQLQVAGEDQANSKVNEPGTKNSLGPGETIFVVNTPGDPDLVVPAGERERYEAAFAHFCRIFPDRFYMEERGRNYFDTKTDRGRYLSAGFHSLMGYFRDDQPLYELILSDGERQQLDGLWKDLDFVASASHRTYTQFCAFGQQGERSITQTEEGTLAATGEQDVTSEVRLRQLQDSYLSKAEGGDPRGVEAVNYFFNMHNDNMRWTEQARLAAEPAQLQALLEFAERAYKHPLSKVEQDDVLSYYRSCRDAGLGHEEAMREGIVGLLMSPDLCYRIEFVTSGQPAVQPLSDYELASRLSYFLWSSLPDNELLAHAAAGDLHQPEVLKGQAQRMLKDPKVRALAVQFGGNWLDFRRFDELATVDRERFPSFTNELREAMYEEPIHFLTDVIQNQRSIISLLAGQHTFVNPVLAKHYGMPVAADNRNNWTRVDDARPYGRGGILPMAAFLTKNSPGLRTSPVKRGNWVVKNVLGEQIPPPPPDVPELPQDEAKFDLPLREMLAKHREDTNCAACHARFDSFGLVFEGFGPVGERREQDLAGRAVDPSANFPDGSDGTGVDGLRRYIQERRQQDFVDNFCRKLVAYGLGRSPMLSDELLVVEMRKQLANSDYRFTTAIEALVTSPQFLNKRGERDE